MNNTEARAIINAAINTSTNPDQIARLELAREYFTNPAFAQALADQLWNNRKGVAA
jgi:hypothetical protein